MILLLIYGVSTFLVLLAAFNIGCRKGHKEAREIFDKANDEIKQIYFEDKSKLVEKHNNLLETLKVTVKAKNNLLSLKENEILRQDGIIQGLKDDIEKMQCLDFEPKKPDLRTRLDITERKEILTLIHQTKVNEVSGD